jgi:hypothetical protein
MMCRQFLAESRDTDRSTRSSREFDDKRGERSNADARDCGLQHVKVRATR